MEEHDGPNSEEAKEHLAKIAENFIKISNAITSLSKQNLVDPRRVAICIHNINNMSGTLQKLVPVFTNACVEAAINNDNNFEVQEEITHKESPKEEQIKTEDELSSQIEDLEKDIEDVIKYSAYYVKRDRRK